jgi:membrane protease YdiL (CAAX protease family)
MMVQDAIPLPPELRRIEELVRGVYEETYRMLIAAGSPWEFVLVVFTVAFVPAVSEEFLFRGLVQHSVEESTGGLRAAIATGIIFGAYHLNPISIVPLVALGAYFGYLAYRSRTLVVAISAHFFNNFVACAAAYMNVRDDFIALAPGGTISIPLVLANTLLFLVVFLGSTYYFVKVTDAQV